MAKLAQIALVGVTAALTATTAFAARAQASDETCRVVRYRVDGSRIETTAKDETTAVARSSQGSSAHASVTAEQSAPGTARSAVSLSSRSGEHGSATASASRTDPDGRIVTTTRDESGCTITIDERRIKGE